MCETPCTKIANVFDKSIYLRDGGPSIDTGARTSLSVKTNELFLAVKNTKALLYIFIFSINQFLSPCVLILDILSMGCEYDLSAQYSHSGEIMKH